MSFLAKPTELCSRKLKMPPAACNTPMNARMAKMTQWFRGMSLCRIYTRYPFVVILLVSCFNGILTKNSDGLTPISLSPLVLSPTITTKYQFDGTVASIHQLITPVQPIAPCTFLEVSSIAYLPSDPQKLCSKFSFPPAPHRPN